MEGGKSHPIRTPLVILVGPVGTGPVKSRFIVRKGNDSDSIESDCVQKLKVDSGWFPTVGIWLIIGG